MRAWIYDNTFKKLTVRWYRTVLERLECGSSLLDVGIGTASALVENASILIERDVSVVGIDIDDDYIHRAQANIVEAGLTQRIRVWKRSIYNHHGGPYDAVYFCASFMLMPDPVAVLNHVKSMLAPHGRIFFTQTFQERKSVLVEKAKPLLIKITTIDFGKVTYEEDFRAILEQGGVEIIDDIPIRRGHSQSFRTMVCRPKA